MSAPGQFGSKDKEESSEDINEFGVDENQLDRIDEGTSSSTVTLLVIYILIAYY